MFYTPCQILRPPAGIYQYTYMHFVGARRQILQRRMAKTRWLSVKAKDSAIGEREWFVCPESPRSSEPAIPTRGSERACCARSSQNFPPSASSTLGVDAAARNNSAQRSSEPLML
jgi:hypothetical protein